MNGEVGLICRLAVAAKNAIKGGEFKFTKLPYENEINFNFCEKGKKAGLMARSAEVWFARLKGDGVEKVFMIMPYIVKDRRALGFVNTTGCTLFAKFSDGTVTRFVPHFTPDKQKRGWNVTFNEDVIENPPELQHFKDNTADFIIALSNIEKFAEHIGCENFAEAFRKGGDVLAGGELPDLSEAQGIPELPEDKLRMYLAADISDVFGAMGSWNDEPFRKALDKELTDDYHKLSETLLGHNRLALMYLVNED